MNRSKNNREIAIPQSMEWISRVRERSKSYMVKYGSCTQSIVAAFMEEFRIEEPMVLRSAGAMHAGLLSSLTCGVHIAGAMVLGLIVGREVLHQGHDGLFPIVFPAQDLMRRLTERLGGHSCRELSGVDFTDLKQAIAFYNSGEYEKCIARVADGAEEIGLFLVEMDERGELFRVEAPHGQMKAKQIS